MAHALATVQNMTSRHQYLWKAIPILMMVMTDQLWRIPERRQPEAASPSSSSSHRIPDSSRAIKWVCVVEEHHVHASQDNMGIASKFALLSPVISHESDMQTIGCIFAYLFITSSYIHTLHAHG
jgi:hypothetical protein